MAQLSRRPDVLGLFAKAPEAGRVKTRLARAVGSARAVSLYREVGRRVAAQCIAPGAWETVVWYAPAGGETAVREWLGGLDVDAFRRQPGHGLGFRLAGTFRRHFAEQARRVVVIGSDCPTVARPLIRRAFRALDRADLVLGPAVDGGFYLLGLTRVVPGLFRGVAWSTAGVFTRVLDNAARLGLSTLTLPEHRDMDTIADARALGLVPPVFVPQPRRHA